MLETTALWALDPRYDMRIRAAGTALEDHSMTRLLNALLRSETEALSSDSLRTIETSKPTYYAWLRLISYWIPLARY
jgi:hypothetical protein